MTLIDARAPGLYLRGRESERLAATATAVTAFVGIAERGPLHSPQILASWGEFLQIFGGFVDYAYLAQSVFGFCHNGGERCYVVRTADTRDRSAENPEGACPRVLELATSSSLVPIRDHLLRETIRLFPINEGSWGDRLRFDVYRDSTRDIELTTLAADAAEGDSTVVVKEIFDIPPGSVISIVDATNRFLKRSYVVTDAVEATDTLTLDSTLGGDFASGSSVFGRGFRIDVIYEDDFQEQRETFDDLSMSPVSPRYFLNVINGTSDITSYIERQRLGHSILVRVEHVLDPLSRFKPDLLLPPAVVPLFRGGQDGFTQALAELSDATGQPSLPIVARERLGRAANGLRVRAERFETKTALAADAGAEAIVVDRAAGFVDGEQLTITHPDDPAITESPQILSVGSDNVITLEPADALANTYPLGSTVDLGDTRYTLCVFESDENDPTEQFDNLSNDSTSGRFVRDVVNGASDLICVDVPHVLAPPVGEAVLAGGRHPGEMGHRFYTGYDAGGAHAALEGVEAGRPGGLATLEGIDEINLLTIPDLDWAGSADVHGSSDPMDGFAAGQYDLLRHCANLGDRFALLDPPGPVSTGDIELDAVAAHEAAPSPEEIAVWPDRLADVVRTRFGALHYPWIEASFPGDRQSRVPPSGFAAGAIARVDRADGVNRAPANVTVKGAFDLGRLVTRAEQADLHPRGVNCVRQLENGQIRIMGARALSTDAAHRYVNVRRVLLFVIKTLNLSMAWAAFEPNDKTLWKRITTSIERFLGTMVSKGMTAGTNAAESFYVKCNEETNPAEVRDAGQVVAEIGLALVAPAEFIVLTAMKTPESLRILEEET